MDNIILTLFSRRFAGAEQALPFPVTKKLFNPPNILKYHNNSSSSFIITLMTFNDKTVLITGAHGFIGMHLTEALVKEGPNKGLAYLH
jgi:hypothetical protein